jgi:hypothetical protein
LNCASFKNNDWKEWQPYGALYWYGNMCEPVSGGIWTPTKMRPNSGTSEEYDLPTVTNTDNYLQFYWQIAGWGGGSAKLATAQDLTDVSYIELDFEGELLQSQAQTWLLVHTPTTSYSESSTVMVNLITKDLGAP